LKLGEQKALEQHDLWHIAKGDEAALVSEKFMARLTSTKDSLDISEGRVGLAMWRAHAKIFVLAGMIKLFHDITMFLGPFILEVLLKHIQNKGSRWVGIGLASALTAANVIETLTVNAYFHMLFRICLHLKTSLIDMLYQKSLKLSVAKTQDVGVGAIVNLQSNDASKLWKLPQYLHMIWSGPFQILAVMGLLIRIIHVWPALVGLCVTVAIIPLSTFVARALARIRKDVMVLTDARVKVSSEVILGIKAIKLYAWEEAYKERILSLREKEMKAIRTAALIGLWNNFLWLGGPIVISMAGGYQQPIMIDVLHIFIMLFTHFFPAAFLTYTLMGYELTAAVAFPALSLFNLLRFPVMMFPTQLLNIINGKVALDRIQRFMDSEEVQQATERQPGDPTISIDRASFYWGPGQDLLLRDINLTIGQGKLVVVIGEVGSGKTSLLSAVLGEMMARTGKSEVRGTIAYTQQEPWILNASLKVNSESCLIRY
jgi:ABC-type multidrug transport system fused ATPase/permease subunit